MALQRVQANLKGKIRAFVVVKSNNNYEPTIIENHECKLAKALLDSGAIVLYGSN